MFLLFHEQSPIVSPKWIDQNMQHWIGNQTTFAFLVIKKWNFSTIRFQFLQWNFNFPTTLLSIFKLICLFIISLFSFLHWLCFVLRRKHLYTMRLHQESCNKAQSQCGKKETQLFLIHSYLHAHAVCYANSAVISCHFAVSIGEFRSFIVYSFVLTN